MAASSSIAAGAANASGGKKPGVLHRRKSFFEQPRKTDKEIRKLLKIKPMHGLLEGTAIFIQRFARQAREDRFRVSAADCQRVSDEVEARREGLHNLLKCVARAPRRPVPLSH